MKRPYLTASPEERMAAEIADLKARLAALESRQTRLRTTAWVAPTLLNGWSNLGGLTAPAGYRIVGGVVWLRGVVTGGTTTVGTTIFTLPAGFRASHRLIFPVVSNNAFGRASVDPDGTVQFFIGSNVWFSLDGIAFVPA